MHKRLLLASLLAASAVNISHAQAPGAVVANVGIIQVAEQDVPFSITASGRATAYELADIRPRVEGDILEVLVEAGQRVKVGDVLFTIDPRVYEINHMTASANVRQAESDFQSAKDNLARKQALKGYGISEAELQSASNSVMSAESRMISARASLETTKINLERTIIKSPINGVASIPNVTKGTLVTANQSASLVTIARLDPIYVDVKESSSRISQVREQITGGTLTPGSNIGIHLLFDNFKEYQTSGKFIAGENSISRTTGTTTLRMEFDNPEHVILPGQYLRTRITLGTRSGILVPQGATSRSSDGSLTVMKVVDGKAHRTRIADSGVFNNSWVVTSGLVAGDTIIVEGLWNVIDGADVNVTPVQINAKGVVEDLPSAGADQGTRH